MGNCLRSLAPQLAIDVDKIFHNAHTLVQRLGRHGIAVTGVTKATLGSPDKVYTPPGLRAGLPERALQAAS